MTHAEIIKELDMLQDIAEAIKEKAAVLKVQLGRISGPAPKGGRKCKKSPLTNDQIAAVLARRRKAMYN